MELSQMGARVALQFLERTTLTAKEIPSYQNVVAELRAIAQGPRPTDHVEAMRKAGTGAKPQAKPRKAKASKSAK